MSDLKSYKEDLNKLYEHGKNVFGSKKNFIRWLKTPNFYFDKNPPQAILRKVGGIKFVDDRLTGMEYGDNA